MSTMTRSQERLRAQNKAALKRARTIYLVRTHPEKFDPLVYESVQNAREHLINSLGTVWDWDCDNCRLAVITNRITDACPHCGK